MFTDIFGKVDSTERISFSAASVHTIVMAEFVDHPLEVIGRFFKRQEGIAVPPGPREVLLAIAETRQLSPLTRRFANASAKALSELFPNHCDGSLDVLLRELAQIEGMDELFAEVDATQDFYELKDWTNRKVHSERCKHNEDVRFGLKAAALMLEMGEGTVYSTARPAYRIFRDGSVSIFKDASGSTQPVAGSVARSDVKGAVAGGVAGCVGGSVAGGVGCLPGAGTGAAVGGLAMSCGELAANIWDSVFG